MLSNRQIDIFQVKQLSTQNLCAQKCWPWLATASGFEVVGASGADLLKTNGFFIDMQRYDDSWNTWINIYYIYIYTLYTHCIFFFSWLETWSQFSGSCWPRWNSFSPIWRPKKMGIAAVSMLWQPNDGTTVSIGRLVKTWSNIMLLFNQSTAPNISQYVICLSVAVVYNPAPFKEIRQLGHSKWNKESLRFQQHITMGQVMLKASKIKNSAVEMSNLA